METNQDKNEHINYNDSEIRIEIKQRFINIELLRIISILMVIILHFLGHGGVLKQVEYFSANYFLLWFIESLSYVAVNCFVLISGYFLIKSKFNIRKVLLFYLQVLFYSIVIYIIFIFMGAVKFNVIEFVYFIFPISTNRYWFATIYFLFYIITPFVNIAILNMSQIQFKITIFTSTVLFSIIPNLLFFGDGFNVKDGYSLIWFIYLYFISAYIRIYYQPKYKKSKFILYYFVLSLLLVGSRIIISILSNYILGYNLGENLFYSYNSILVLPASIFLFLFFLNYNIKSLKNIGIVSSISSLSFGVYLIHEHPYMRDFLWKSLIKPAKYANSTGIFLYIIISIFGIYTISCIIEKMRQLIFSYIIKSKSFKKLLSFLDEKLSMTTINNNT